MAQPLGLSRVSVTWFQERQIYRFISKTNLYFEEPNWTFIVLSKWAYCLAHGSKVIVIRLKVDGMQVLKSKTSIFLFTIHVSMISSLSLSNCPTGYISVHFQSFRLFSSTYTVWIGQNFSLGASATYGPSTLIHDLPLLILLDKTEVSGLGTKECVLNQAYRLRE